MEPAEAAALVAQAIAAVTPVTRDSHAESRVTKRDGNRKRQAARRNRLKLAALAGEAQANDGASCHAPVTRDGVTTASSVVVLSIQGKGLSVEEESKKARKTESARARGTRMQAGALLSDEHRAIIVAEGIQDPDRLWAEFVDYWSDIPGQRGCKISWSGTLRNRCRDVIKRGFQFTGAKNGKRTVHDAARDLSATVAARFREFDEPAPELCDETGRNALRLLPSR